MANPFVHAIVVLIAILIPGGLVAYFAWHARRRRLTRTRTTKSQKAKPTPEEARQAFLTMYPRDSLRRNARENRLARARAFRRRKSEK